MKKQEDEKLGGGMDLRPWGEVFIELLREVYSGERKAQDFTMEDMMSMYHKLNKPPSRFKKFIRRFKFRKIITKVFGKNQN